MTLNSKKSTKTPFSKNCDISWKSIGSFSDVLLYVSQEGIARISINRPEKRNAFRPQTVSELCEAFSIVRNKWYYL